jgi:hypothetical protein
MAFGVRYRRRIGHRSRNSIHRSGRGRTNAAWRPIRPDTWPRGIRGPQARARVPSSHLDRQPRAACDRASLFHPDLIEQNAVRQVVLVVPQASGDEVAPLVEKKGPEGEIDRHTVGFCPSVGGGRGVRRLEVSGLLDEGVSDCLGSRCSPRAARRPTHPLSATSASSSTNRGSPHSPPLGRFRALRNMGPSLATEPAMPRQVRSVAGCHGCVHVCPAPTRAPAESAVTSVQRAPDKTPPWDARGLRVPCARSIASRRMSRPPWGLRH